jgi:hypothetical protein
MKRKIVPLIILIFGAGSGLGFGLLFRPALVESTEGQEVASEVPKETEIPPEYVKLSNQFVIPVVEDGKVISMVILSLSLEVIPGVSESVYSKEPKLRDAFLQVLFDHANAGGFRGSFTDSANLILLREALRESATSILDKDVKDVLINEIMRQDT